MIKIYNKKYATDNLNKILDDLEKDTEPAKYAYAVDRLESMVKRMIEEMDD